MKARPAFLLQLAAIYAAACALQRLVYVLWIRADASELPPGVPMAFAKGFTFDIATCGFLFLPLGLALGLLPARWGHRRAGRAIVVAFALLPLFTGLLAIAFEFFFWEEFRSRYNFIAVDYLVYTHEVVRNIWESYPVLWFSLGFGTLIASIAWLLRRRVRRLTASPAGLAERGALLAGLAALIGLNLSLNEQRWLENETVWARELSKNSLYALFSAYNHNEIDYRRFYLSLGEEEARRRTREWIGGETREALPREIRAAGPEKKWNVMFVAIESMSARFLQRFGNDRPLTPNLDRFAGEGVFFTQMYATGSRTVRGLEALMLSLPPTPGQSILRRPGSGGLFNLGTMFRERGYTTQFIYGGYARFDNMGPWFQSNGFGIVDRGSFAPGGVSFATAWGACDEDLFAESIRRADAAVAEGKPFLQVLLTTSNHRPYDYPDGRIDIPSHTGRDGAVKYTDYAIGKFVEEARKKPWYGNTLFVFAADHNASVAGGTELPIRDYLIPVIFHNPELVKPRVIGKLSSQIDVAPTLLSLMGFSYRSWFFGQDLLREPGGRALIGTYQKVAYLEPGRLTILEPNRKALIQELGPEGQVKGNTRYLATDELPETVKLAAALYQSASDLFQRGLSKVVEGAR